MNHFNKGRKPSLEARLKMRVARLGVTPWNKGKVCSIETRTKISNSQKGRKPTLLQLARAREVNMGNKYSLGVIHSEETKRKIGMAGVGRKASLATREKMSQAQRGENHYRWNPNREAVRRDLRNDPIYKQWSKCVKSRDFWKCKISNKDCSGKVVAHHILPWAKFPELRYEINNGITLCHTHHPKKRNDEIIFAPVFQKMVSNILAN